MKKEKIYRRYERAFADLPVSMNPYLKESKPNFWLSCLLIDRDCPVTPMSVLERLATNGIEGRPIWKPMSMQPVFKGHDLVKVEESAVGADIFSRGLCLPSDIKMTDEEQDFVIQVVKSCF